MHGFPQFEFFLDSIFRIVLNRAKIYPVLVGTTHMPYRKPEYLEIRRMYAQ